MVGAALGLRLRAARITRWGLGWTWFPEARAHSDALVTAAGIAWERAVGGVLDDADRTALRRIVRGSRIDQEACSRAAAAILESRSAAHARVTRALLERDLGAADIEAIARGEAPPDVPGEKD